MQTIPLKPLDEFSKCLLKVLVLLVTLKSFFIINLSFLRCKNPN
ncbi:putative membrane protein [Helicobacter pylori UMB_G1]|nr:putative membrane protein [Helicobacter pylori UMB_G1]